MRDLGTALYELYVAFSVLVDLVKALFAIVYAFCAEQEDVA
jgi:hypothetical protein